MSHTDDHRQGMGEEEPLLGESGDASQQDGKPLYHNFIIGKLLWSFVTKQHTLTMNSGTGVVAQAGAWIVRKPSDSTLA